MPLNLSNPFQPSRFGNIMNQPVDRSFGNVDFNPATQESNPYQNQKRLFSGAMPETAPKFRVQQQEMPQEDTTDAETSKFYNMLKGVGGARPARTAYQEALQNQPNAADYQPSGWRRIGAAITGAAGGLNQGAQVGTQLGENFLESPYKGALSDYQRRLAGLEQSAQMESQDVSDERENLVTAANYGMSRGDKQFTRHIQQSGVDQKRAELQATHDKDMAQAERWRAQSNNEMDKNSIDAWVAERTAEHNNAMAAIGRTNAGANVTSAGAAASNAVAAHERAAAAQTAAEAAKGANKGKAMSYEEGYDFALKQMSNEPQFRGKVIPNTSQIAGSPNFILAPGTPKSIQDEANRRASEISGKTIGGLMQPDVSRFRFNGGLQVAE